MTTSTDQFSGSLAKPDTTHLPWLMLFGRTGLFLAVQALFTLVFFLIGSNTPIDQGAGTWPFVVTITNLVMLAILVRLYRGEGKNYWQIFRIQRGHIKSDLAALVGLLVVGGPLGYLPNVILATWLFGDSQQVLALFLRPLPTWAVIASIIAFPITQGLVEIPNYFSYVMPRLQAQGLRRWQAVAIPALMLGLQHLAVPFVFDIRFIIWRASMYIPFAFLVGILLSWRPRLLPYIAIIHILMDASFAAMLLGVAY